MTDLFLDPSDAELLQRYRDGDDDAAGMLFERHHPSAVRLAGALAGASAAEDLASDAFVAVLRAVRNGAGPQFAFRPYLLTSVRNGFYAASKAASRQDLYDDLETAPDAPTVADGTALREESSLLAQAFATLPERWQAVLWHTTIHDESPEQVAQVLGIKPNAVSSLALRAREGLRNAYLTAHLGQTDDPECREVRELLPAYDRGRLRPRAHARVEAHLEVCDDCREAAVLVGGITADLGLLLLPALLGAPGVAAFGSGPVGSGNGTDDATTRGPRSPKDGVAASTAAGSPTVGAAASTAAGSPSTKGGATPASRSATRTPKGSAAALSAMESAAAIAAGAAIVMALVGATAVGVSLLGSPDDTTIPSAAATARPAPSEPPPLSEPVEEPAPTPSEPVEEPTSAPLAQPTPPELVEGLRPSNPRSPSKPVEEPTPSPSEPVEEPTEPVEPPEEGEDLAVTVLEAIPGDVYEVTLAVTSSTVTPLLHVELPPGMEVSLWGGDGWSCTEVGTTRSCEASGPNPQPIRFWWGPGATEGFLATVSAPGNVDPNPANDSVTLG